MSRRACGATEGFTVALGTTSSTVGTDLPALAVVPGHHVQALGNEAGDGAPHEGVVAQDHVLLAHVRLVRLDDDCKAKGVGGVLTAVGEK